MYAHIGMRPKQIGIGRNHLRFEPNAEFQPYFMHFINKRRQAVGEFFLIYKPIAQRGFIVVSMPKPTVIHNEHINPQILCRHRKIEQFFAVDIKIRRFPTVDKNRAFFVLVFPFDKVLVIKFVEGSAHFP